MSEGRYFHFCQGLKISSEIELAAPALDPGLRTGPFDLKMTMGGEREPQQERPSEETLAELNLMERRWYTFSRTSSGYTGRFYGAADFEITEQLDEVICYPIPGLDPGYVPILLAGSIVSFVLSMRGKCVLHASAVEVGGKAIAFVGMSGQGKSTMSALLCSEGAKLLTDDVMPVTLERDGEGGPSKVMVLNSGHEIRLREKAASLAERIDGESRTTADERLAVNAERSGHKEVQLSLIIVPYPDKSSDDVEAHRFAPSEAVVVLSRFSRIEGWQYKPYLVSQFAQLTELVSVPVFAVRVPWGPPFPEGLGARVLEACSQGYVLNS